MMWHFAYSTPHCLPLTHHTQYSARYAVIVIMDGWHIFSLTIFFSRGERQGGTEVATRDDRITRELHGVVEQSAGLILTLAMDERGTTKASLEMLSNKNKTKNEQNE